jgi:hypothetical protein
MSIPSSCKHESTSASEIYAYGPAWVLECAACGTELGPRRHTEAEALADEHAWHEEPLRFDLRWKGDLGVYKVSKPGIGDVECIDAAYHDATVDELRDIITELMAGRPSTERRKEINTVLLRMQWREANSRPLAGAEA